MNIPASPLSWPVAWKRTPASRRARARFASRGSSGMSNVSIAEATMRVMDALDRMRVPRSSIVISSNLQLRNDGLPRSGQPEPVDTGVAVYWLDHANEAISQRCMAIDRYDRVADNLAAIAATLEAMRAIERHGGAEILNRAFQGFAALPAPAAGKRMHWSEVLGCARDASMSTIRNAWLRARSAAHPDHGGTPAEFKAVNQAYSEACREHEVES